MIESENFRSFPCYDMLGRCFHFGVLKFLFPVCFFWLFWLLGCTDNQCFTTWKQIIQKKIRWSFVQNHSLARRALLPQKRAAARRKAFSWYGMSVLFYYMKTPKGHPFGAMELILLWLCPGRISRSILLRLCCCAMPANTRRRRCRNKWRFAAKA